MIEDNKNNDNKEELTTSPDEKNMDTQNIEENKDLKNIEIDQENSESDNQLKEKKVDEVKEQKDESVKDEVKEQKDESVKDEVKEQKDESVEEDQVLDNKEEKSQEDKKEDNPDAKWYVVGAASGFEERAVTTIKDNARKASLGHFFFDFQIPKQEIVEIKKGKKVNSEKNFFPGYMLVKMIMNNQTWQLVKNTNKVSGFTGNDHKPIPLSQNEAMKMLKKADDSIEYIAPKYVYEVGQQVKVIDGPFASFNGMVEEVDEERGRLKISVSIFGRSTPVELEYTQVEKI
tara:strand:- start:1942 stop:2805 length:864 start_codon:yes stop_codon:yes gene_type:complete